MNANDAYLAVPGNEVSLGVEDEEEDDGRGRLGWAHCTRGGHPWIPRWRRWVQSL